MADEITEWLALFNMECNDDSLTCEVLSLTESQFENYLDEADETLVGMIPLKAVKDAIKNSKEE